MAKLAVALIAFSCILLQQSDLVASLQCYSCTGSLNSNSNCENLQYLYPSYCGSGQVCASFVLQKPTVDILRRTCATHNICDVLESQYQNNPEVSVRGCSVCDQDNCNSATTF